MDKVLMTLPDFCGRFSISRSSLYRGRLRVVHVGKRVYVAAVDAAEWLENLRGAA